MPPHPVPVLAPATYAKFNACVHCGLCLPACPTYVETLDEADSPRGRILLMKAAVDGRAGVSDILFEHLDRCLVCRACETACPSGVQYHDLLESVRPQIARSVLGPNNHIRSSILQWVIGTILPHPKRLAAALVPLNLARHFGLTALLDRFMPGAIDLAQSAAQSRRQSAGEIPSFTPAVGGPRATVILLRGCVGSVVSAHLNAACVRVLSHNGFDVHILPAEPCCGALAAHANDPHAAHAFAADFVDALADRQADYLISPIAGCSAQLKMLGKILADSPAYAPRAQALASRVRDICEFLIEVGIQLPPPLPNPTPRTATYHDPCHLAHAQHITQAPRKLLALIPGLRLVPLPDCDMCCGAAGPYSLNQPAMAHRLGTRKARQILATGAQELLTANIGCALQITRHLRAAGHNLPVRHVLELLAEAYDPTPCAC